METESAVKGENFSVASSTSFYTNYKRSSEMEYGNSKYLPPMWLEIGAPVLHDVEMCLGINR